MHGKATKITGIVLIVVGGILFGLFGFSETYFGVRHLFYESPLYPLSMMFIITGFLMVLGGTLFDFFERKRTEDQIIRSKLQVAPVIRGYWKRGQTANLHTLCNVFGLTQNTLKLKIFEAMGEGGIDGEFGNNEFLPRKASQMDGSNPGAGNPAG